MDQEVDVDRLRKDNRNVDLAVTFQESSGNAATAKTAATCLHMFVPKAFDMTVERYLNTCFFIFYRLSS